MFVDCWLSEHLVIELVTTNLGSGRVAELFCGTANDAYA